MQVAEELYPARDSLGQVKVIALVATRADLKPHAGTAVDFDAESKCPVHESHAVATGCSSEPNTHMSASQYGFATFRLSLRPVSGSLYSFQDTGYIALPASLTAMMTPSSLLAVER